MLLLILNLINTLFPLIICVAALYIYLKIEKEKNALLLGIGFLFLLLAEFEAWLKILGTFFAITENSLKISNDTTNLWPFIFRFIGYAVLFIMAEPWKILNKE
ncbi:MAG: hypothetical protein ACTSRU_00825 [Candidatus Hodarchaeales archaeon]